tara:strand:- start:100 stop:792 length:693 start_codon:yes stop_codon:yes gene_type:complete
MIDVNIEVVNVAGIRVHTSSETDGFGLNTCQEAVYVFNEFAQGRKFNNALECFCGPGYYGIGLWAAGIVKNISFSDIAPESEEVMRKTFEDNNLDFSFYLSDVFNNIPKQEKFDLIVGNPPHFNKSIPNDNEMQPCSHEDRKMQDLDWEIHKKFYSQVGEYLTDDGSIMLMEAWDGSRPETFQSMWEENGLEYHKFFPSKDLMEKENNNAPDTFTGGNYFIEVKKKCVII